MNCERFKTRLTDFALGAEDIELGAHLDGCTACRDALEAQRALLASIDRGLASMTDGEPSGDFAAHVRQRIAEQAAAPRPWFSGWLPVSAAALALVILATFLLLPREGPPPETAKETLPAQTARPPREPQLAQKFPEISVPANASGPRTIRPPRGQRTAASREPEVLVPRSEMAAVLRLFNANWSGKADGASLTAQLAPMSDFLKPLSIEELKIPALEVIPLEGDELPKGAPKN